MHANDSELIALRDEEPVDAAMAAHVHHCSICLRKLERIRELRSALRSLPVLPPPDRAWTEIVARREKEMLPRRHDVRHYANVASVACVAVVASLVTAVTLRENAEPEAGTAMTAQIAENDVTDLRARSRALEYLLQQYGSPAVMNLRTAGAVSELEDSIGLIDYQLNVAGSLDGADARRQEHELWRQRVELMETLVTVRAANDFLDDI